MKKIMIIFMFASLLGSSCASKVLILRTPVISMKKRNSGSKKSLKEGKQVVSRWCSGDTPVVKNTDGSKHYGLIDQAVHRAHKEHKASFFMNNRFYQEGTCVEMQANVAR